MTNSRFWKTLLLDSAALFLLTAALIRPLFTLRYADNWGSIESTFISDARFLKDHWPHPRWQPLWYCGTRFDYIYPPALRYGTAALAKLFSADPARGYHIYTALFYCAGIAAVYVFIRMASGSRGAAWLGAAAAALLSPSFLFLAHMRKGAPWLAPVRWSALVRYGEGPHMTAVALLPLALAASFCAIQKRRPAALALAAVFCALVVAHNFYGAMALATFYPILFWALWITHRDHRMWWRAAAIPALAYGLSAFWLVPSYFRVTAANLEIVSAKGNVWSIWVALGVAGGFGWISKRLAWGKPERAYPMFVCGAAVFFSLIVLGNHFFGFRVSGEPERLVPELDLALILLAAEGLRAPAGLKKRTWFLRYGAIAVALVCLGTAKGYVRRAWRLYVPDQNFQQRIEYRLTEWIAKNAPDARSAATGSVRFWFNAWHDLAQLGGGSEQGLLNRVVERPQWELMLGQDPEPAILWMQCLGVDLVIVHDRTSQELYHDLVFPHKFAGVLPVIYNDGEGNFIYRVPRRFPGLARVVSNQSLASIQPGQLDLENVRACAAMVEKGPEAPAWSARQGTDALQIQATVQPGESVLVQMSYDPAWRAYSGGRAFRIRPDPLGQMVIDTPAGAHDLALVFELPLENRIGRIVSSISAAAVIALLVIGLRAEEVGD